MNFSNLVENFCDVDFLSLVLAGIVAAEEQGSHYVQDPDLKKIRHYAETNYRTHELTLQMAIVMQQARDGLNPWCEKIAKNLLIELL